MGVASHTRTHTHTQECDAYVSFYVTNVPRDGRLGKYTRARPITIVHVYVASYVYYDMFNTFNVCFISKKTETYAENIS